MIGGYDIVIPAVGDSAAMDACARIVQRHWPNVRFEDAITGDKYLRLSDIPFGKVRELLAYRDDKAEAGWDADSPDSPENSMLNLIVTPNDITVVLDNPDAADVRSILHSIQGMLWTFILYSFAEAA